VVTVVVLAVVGVTASSGPSTASLGRAPRIVVVSIPGLQWRDLDASDTPNLDALLPARALLSVRTVHSRTTALDGYLTLGAGNRLAVERNDQATLGAGDGCIDIVAAAKTAAGDQLTGAEPGALGDALHEAGRTTAVFGGGAAIAGLMRSSGCVDVYATEIPDLLPADVNVVEFAGLDVRTDGADRLRTLLSIERAIGRLGLTAADLVIVVAPSAPGEASEVTVAGARVGTGLLSSGTTRRSGYVTLPDVAPTVLAALGIDAPASMSGTPIRADLDSSADADVSDLSDLAERVAFRDSAVGPVSVVFVVLNCLCALAAIAGRGRMARMIGPIVAAFPLVTFLAGFLPVHHLPLDFVVVMIPVVAATVATIAVASWSRWGRWAPTTILFALLWVVLVVDIVSGGSLQINTVLGYTPTIAGRFQGFGNLASALVCVAALSTAVAPMLFAGRADNVPTSERAQRPRPLCRASTGWWMGWVATITMISVAVPAFGSDVGGTLMLVPAIVLIAVVVSGRRMGLRRVAGAVLIGILVIVGLAAADLTRPSSSRTHLGRFADTVLHGDGGLVIRRKLHGNLAILTSSFWSVLLLGGLLVTAATAWRYREQLSRFTAGVPAVRVFLIGFATLAALGFAVNDSGIAIPAVMLGVGVPWMVSVVVEPASRASRA
jgi:hypothetical protein